MARHLHDFKTVSILNGGTDSAAIFAGQNAQSGATLAALGSVESFTVFSPTTLPETITIQVAPNNNPAAGDWKTLQLSGTGAATDVTIAAGKAVNISLAAGFKAIRIHSGSAVAAQRDFQVIFQIDSEYGGGGD